MEKDTKSFIAAFLAMITVSVALLIYILSHHNVQPKVMVRIEQPTQKVQAYTTQRSNVQEI